MKLTAKALAAYRAPDKSDYIVFDDDIAGFGLRYRDGRRSWIFQYAIGAGANRITRRIKIGDYPALSPAKAREQAEDLHAKVHLHGDPAIERRKTRMEAGKTFEKLVQQYLDYKKDQLRPRSFAEVQRHLEVNAKPLHSLPLASVDQAAIASRLNALAKNGAISANRTRASLSAMFVWAMGEGLAVANPVANTNRREEKTRDRVLSDAELRTIWHSLEDDDYGMIVKLLSRWPYQVTMVELVAGLGTTPWRCILLFGLLSYRRLLTNLGYAAGVQFVDGSFVENVETREGRDPGDIDLFSASHADPVNSRFLLAAHSAAVPT
jgi:hypothetical protein